MDIDVVITWVDGQDPEFNALRQRYIDAKPANIYPQLWTEQSRYTGKAELEERALLARKHSGSGTISNSAESQNRFRSSDELRFAVRSIEKFAPWIRHIYILTNGQVPRWFDGSGGRVKIITHQQIFRNQDHLPTFNSNAIELNIHRIPGLSENFIYFNDDLFFGRPVSLRDFITADGRHLLFMEKGKPLPLSMSDRSLIGHCWAFNHQLLNSVLPPVKKRNHYAHTPQLYNRRLMEEIQLVWWQECELTSSYKFRTPFDVAFRILYTHYVGNPKRPMLAMGGQTGVGEQVELGDYDYIFVKFGDDRSTFAEDLGAAYLQRPRFFCINDEVNVEDEAVSAAAAEALQDFLYRYFPEPSSAEKRSESGRKGSPMLVATGEISETTEFSGVSVLSVAPTTTGVKLSVKTDQSEFWVTQPIAASRGLGLINRGDIIRLSVPAPVTSLACEFEVIAPDDGKAVLRGFTKKRKFVMFFDISDRLEITADAVLAEYQNRLRFMKAIEAKLTPLLSQPPSYPQSHFVAAERSIRLGEITDQTFRRLNAAAAGGVDPFWVAHRRILALLAVGKRQDALGELRFALQLNPKSHGMFADLARGLASTGMYLEALVVADALTEVAPKDLTSMYLRSLCRHHTGGEDPDIDLLMEIAKGDPSSTALWIDVQVRAGNLSDHIEESVGRARRGHPKSLVVAEAAFKFYSARSEASRAMAALSPAIVAAASPDRLCDLASAEIKLGRSAAAQVLYDVLVDRYGNHPRVVAVGSELKSLHELDRSA